MIHRPLRSTLFPFTTLFQSLDPLHPEARRDLALLDGRLQPDEVIDPNRPLAPLTLTGQADLEPDQPDHCPRCGGGLDRKSTRLNSSHANISYAVFCLKKK